MGGSHHASFILLTGCCWAFPTIAEAEGIHKLSIGNWDMVLVMMGLNIGWLRTHGELNRGEEGYIRMQRDVNANHGLVV
ncbi:hypothetical protein VNO77_04354 [Canavalia gladiata]|uniref:Uncharacterized protein n=1 Tax=Canavalia gladiata TaxID=3824 RepID=A0AAN9MWD1_CANGL